MNSQSLPQTAGCTASPVQSAPSPERTLDYSGFSHSCFMEAIDPDPFRMLDRVELYIRAQFNRKQDCRAHFHAREILLQAMSRVLDQEQL